MGESVKLLIVCSGNICRSPMAEAMARREAADRGFGVEVRSGSTLMFEGDPAHPHAVAAMAEWGTDISGHRTAPLTVEMIRWADYILVMEDYHIRHIRARVPDIGREPVILARFVGKTEIDDPIQNPTLRAFRSCRDELKRCIEAFFEATLGSPLD